MSTPDIIKAYRVGAKTPSSRWKYRFVYFVLGFCFGYLIRGHAQQVVVANRNATDEILLLSIQTSEMTSVTHQVPVKANSFAVYPVPLGSLQLGVDKTGDSWGLTGGIPAPGAGQTVYVYIGGTQTYAEDGVFTAYDTGGGSSSAGPSLADQAEIFMYGFFAMMSWEIFGLMWRTFRERVGNAIGS